MKSDFQIGDRLIVSWSSKLDDRHHREIFKIDTKKVYFIRWPKCDKNRERSDRWWFALDSNRYCIDKNHRMTVLTKQVLEEKD